MLRTLINNWWLLMVRGVFALIFAAAVIFFQPFLLTALLKVVAYTALTTLFGVFALVTGVTTLAAAVWGGRHLHQTWLLLVDGLAVTAGGVLVLALPSLTLANVILLIAGTAVLVGAFEISAGLKLRRHLADESLLLAGGIVSLAFGFLLFITRTRDLQSALIWVAMYALTNGLAMTGLAIRLFRLRRSVHILAGAGAENSHSKTRTGSA